MQKDPRGHRRYKVAARAYIAGHASANCCLCGQPVMLTASSNAPYGPTVEHRYPIRRIRAEATTWAECLALACDVSLWGIAHRRCQARQGAIAANKARGQRRRVLRQFTTREW